MTAKSLSLELIYALLLSDNRCQNRIKNATFLQFIFPRANPQQTVHS